jgi:hypothetical protein
MTPMTLFSPHSGGFRATRSTHLCASRTGGNDAESAAVFQKILRLALSLGAVAAGVRNREGKWQPAEAPSAPTARESVAE